MKLLEDAPQIGLRLVKPPSVRARVADVTRAAHEALHTHPVLCRLMADDLGREEYERILLRHLEFYEAAERLNNRFKIAPALSFITELTSLHDDLQGHEKPEPYEGLVLETQCQALGMLYVLHGSRFGARLICKNLKSALPMRGHKFFSNPMMRDRWSMLLSELERKGAQNCCYSEILFGAEATFSSFGAAMMAASNHSFHGSHCTQRQ